MFIYSAPELLCMVMAAMLLDWVIGDPRSFPHPVVMMGKWIAYLESKLYQSKQITYPDQQLDLRGLQRKRRGVLLVVLTLVPVTLLGWIVVYVAEIVHPWMGYAVQTWLISTTIAMKGLRQAAWHVYVPLTSGDIIAARKNVGEIVGRKTDELAEADIIRATVETVAENTVDAVISPLFFALIGGAPLALFYRGANTLDSMVGYQNERYIQFGWAAARWDDFLNWIPARITGALLIIACLGTKDCSAQRALRSIRSFAHLHLSPNSGIPEAAVAGALGIQLGGPLTYGNIVSDRAELGWPLRKREPLDIIRVNRLLYRVGMISFGGLLCAFFIVW